MRFYYIIQCITEECRLDSCFDNQGNPVTMHESALLHRVVLVTHSNIEKIKTIERLASYSPHIDLRTLRTLRV